MQRACMDGKWGTVYDNGKVAIPFQYEVFERFRYGYAWVKRDGKWGLIDKTGTVVTPCRYDQRNVVDNGKYAWVSRNGKWGILFAGVWGTVTGNEILPCEYDAYVHPWLVKKGEKWGAVLWRNRNPAVVILPCEYDEIRGFTHISRWPVGDSTRYAYIRKGKLWGLADVQGNIRIPCVCEKIGHCHERLLRVKKDGKWGYMNKKGAVVIPFQYDHALDFEADSARVKKDGLWGLIDSNGNEKLPCKYDKIELDHSMECYGYCTVWKNGKCYYDWPHKLRERT